MNRAAQRRTAPAGRRARVGRRSCRCGKPPRPDAKDHRRTGLSCTSPPRQRLRHGAAVSLRDDADRRTLPPQPVHCHDVVTAPHHPAQLLLGAQSLCTDETRSQDQRVVRPPARRGYRTRVRDHHRARGHGCHLTDPTHSTLSTPSHRERASDPRAHGQQRSEPAPRPSRRRVRERGGGGLVHVFDSRGWVVVAGYRGSPRRVLRPLAPCAGPVLSCRAGRGVRIVGRVGGGRVGAGSGLPLPGWSRARARAREEIRWGSGACSVGSGGPCPHAHEEPVGAVVRRPRARHASDASVPGVPGPRAHEWPPRPLVTVRAGLHRSASARVAGSRAGGLGTVEVVVPAVRWGAAGSGCSSRAVGGVPL